MEKKELNPDTLKKAAGGESVEEDFIGQVDFISRMRRFVRNIWLWNITCEEALKLTKSAFEGYVPTGEIEAYVKMEYGM